jgi:hypothetical protein|nr:MAG TPA: hypothetical protein [Bacteriophage sp.]
MSNVLDTLIFDRTVDDLINDTDKAYIAYTDLNRVEETCKHLANLFGVSISTKVWDMEDFRTESEMARMLDNIKKVREAYYTKISTPQTPARITYDSIYQANDIERILKDLGDMYESALSGQQRLSFSLGRKSIGNRR